MSESRLRGLPGPIATRRLLGAAEAAVANSLAEEHLHQAAMNESTVCNCTAIQDIYSLQFGLMHFHCSILSLSNKWARLVYTSRISPRECATYTQDIQTDVGFFVCLTH